MANAPGPKLNKMTKPWLTAYAAAHLSQLTGGEQRLGLDRRFYGDVSAAGL